MTTEARRASKKRATVQMLLVYWYVTQMVPHEAHVIHTTG